MEHGISHILGEAISENNGRGVAARKTGTNSKTIIFCNKVQRMGQVNERQNVLSIGQLICDDGFDLKRLAYLEIRLQRKVIGNVIERLWSVKRNLFEIDRLSVLSPFVELRV